MHELNPDKLICVKKFRDKYIIYLTVKYNPNIFVHVYIDMAKNERSVLEWNRSINILRGIPRKQLILDRRQEFDWI